jgi:hypothetical protein
VSRERFFTSSLPGLTRQSMQKDRLGDTHRIVYFATRQNGPPGQARW